VYEGDKSVIKFEPPNYAEEEMRTSPFVHSECYPQREEDMYPIEKMLEGRRDPFDCISLRPTIRKTNTPKESEEPSDSSSAGSEYSVSFDNGIERLPNTRRVLRRTFNMGQDVPINRSRPVCIARGADKLPNSDEDSALTREVTMGRLTSKFHPTRGLNGKIKAPRYPILNRSEMLQAYGGCFSGHDDPNKLVDQLWALENGWMPDGTFNIQGDDPNPFEDVLGTGRDGVMHSIYGSLRNNMQQRSIREDRRQIHNNSEPGGGKDAAAERIVKTLYALAAPTDAKEEFGRTRLEATLCPNLGSEEFQKKRAELQEECKRDKERVMGFVNHTMYVHCLLEEVH
jgi:hypothetical protein